MNHDPRYANLQRAAALPWTDEGRCVVQEASQSWSVLVERCYHALDHDRVEFHDTTGRCSVASAGAAAMGLGMCVLLAPEIVAGAVVVTGIVAVGFAIKKALEVYELKKGRSQVEPTPETHPVDTAKPDPPKPSPEQRPKPEPKGPDFPPVQPPDTSERERNKCEPVPMPYHLGGNRLHDLCADRVPNNSNPGGDVIVNGKNFDALQMDTRTLWEVKTDDFDTRSPHTQRFFARMKLPEIQHERELAEACGYKFIVGVRSSAHKAALLALDPDLTIIVMDWC